MSRFILIRRIKTRTYLHIICRIWRYAYAFMHNRFNSQHTCVFLFWLWEWINFLLSFWYSLFARAGELTCQSSEYIPTQFMFRLNIPNQPFVQQLPLYSKIAKYLYFKLGRKWKKSHNLCIKNSFLGYFAYLFHVHNYK